MSNTKICTHCQEEKDLAGFEHRKQSKDGYKGWCRTCTIAYRREYYNKHKVEAQAYAMTYYASHIDKQRANHKARRLTPAGIYDRFGYSTYARKYPTSISISRKAFVAWFNKQSLECYYCKQPLVFSGYQGNSLTIDRKDNTKGYTMGNICLACFRCNRAKSNTFTEEQFLEIAKQYFKDNG